MRTLSLLETHHSLKHLKLLFSFSKETLRAFFKRKQEEKKKQFCFQYSFIGFFMTRDLKQVVLVPPSLSLERIS